MNEFNTKDLKSNTIINHALYLDDNFILHDPDVVISDSFFERLQNSGITLVKFNPGPGDDAAIREVGGVEHESQKDTLNEAKIFEELFPDSLLERYAGWIGRLNKIYDTFIFYREIDVKEVSALIYEINHEVKAYPGITIIPDQPVFEASYIVVHSVKSAILSNAITRKMGYNIHEQTELGLAALLHKIGMVQLPEKINSSDRKLTDDEFKVLKTHPHIGYRALKEAGFSTNICAAVQDQAERLDGQGYPRGIKGSQISEYARIISVASAYAAAVTVKSFHPALDRHTAILDLLKDADKIYDRRIIKSLVLTLSLYPIDTFLELDDHGKGVVVGTNSENLKVIDVKLLLDCNGHKLEKQVIIRVGEEGGRQVLRSLSKKEKQEIVNILSE